LGTDGSRAAHAREAIEQGGKPLHHFLVRFAREKDIRLFIEIAHSPAPRTPAIWSSKSSSRPTSSRTQNRVSNWRGSVSAFLIIDLVIASVTLSIGMVQLPPVMISRPSRYCLCAGGRWNLVVGSLMKSFYS